MRSVPPRWVVVIALATVTFAVANPLAAFGVFLPVLSEAFGWSRGAISIALSINMLLGGLVGFGMGALGDRYGPRGVLSATVAVAGIGFALGSTIGALWQLYLFLGVLVGIGASSLYVLTTTTVVRWFTERRGLALAMVLTGFNLGFVTGGPMAAFLIDRVGWRAAYVVLGALVCGAGGLAALLVRDPPTADAGEPPSPRTPVPAPAGRRTDNPTGASGGRRSAGEPGMSNPDMTFREALVSRSLWLMALAWLLLGGVLMMLMVHIVPFAKDRGISLRGASLVLTAYGTGAVSGRIFFGALADRFSSLGAMCWCVAIEVVALGALLLGPPHWVLVLLLMGFGFGFAGADTLVVKVIPDVFGLRALGAIMGVLAFGWRVGAATGPAAAGFVFDATGAYLVPFSAGTVLLVVSFILFVLAVAGPTSGGRRGRR